ncbi:MAG: metalloregulator ArsR/SmtB family transcription factor [Tepidiformaceae bacterium]
MPELLPIQLLDHVAERFRVLGDATRLTILRTLLEADELNVSELVARVDTTQANVSKHLGVLLRAGIVRRRPEGTTAYYSVADPTLKPICEIVCDRLRQQNEEAAQVFATN